MGNACSECQNQPTEVVQSTSAFVGEEVKVEEVKEVKEEVNGTKEAVVVAEAPAGPAPCTPPAQLNITFLSVAGKESEMSFKTQPLPFQCKPQAKGGCCASGTTGKVVIAKVDAKKAKELYDLKAGMIIFKIDGCDLLKDQDFQEFQKMLAEKTEALPEEPKEAPQEVPKEAPKEAPKEESKEAPAEAPTEEVKDIPTEEAKDTPKEEAVEEPKEEAKEALEEETKEAPKEGTEEACK